MTSGPAPGLLGPAFLAAALSLVASAVTDPHAQTAADEPPPVLTASALLPPEQLKGPHHTVAEAVTTPDEYHQFQIASDFGPFTAMGRSELAVRLEEIAALAELQDLNKGGVFARAAGQSLVKVGVGVVNAVTDPVDTAKGIGSGIKRWGVNLGRRTKRVVQKARANGGGESSAGEKVGNAAGAAAKSVFGVNRARREWAKRVGADPYTTNPVLKRALEETATVAAAGGIAAGIAVPIPRLVSTTSDVGDLVWGRDSEDLRRLNEQRARDVGATDDGRDAFFGNFTYTLTMQTRLVAALAAVNVPGVGDYLESAAEANEDREAAFFVDSAEMLRALHATSPVTAVLPDSRAVVARMASGEAVLLLPFDWLRWTGATGQELREIAARATDDLKATSLRIQVSGRITERATHELAALGWSR